MQFDDLGRVGTLYGAYDLLHRLGCRWFAPGEVHEEVPQIEQIPDLDVTERPDFSTRGFYAWEDRGTPELLQWMARNRLDYWCVEQSGHALMNKLGNLDGGKSAGLDLFRRYTLASTKARMINSMQRGNSSFRLF